MRKDQRYRYEMFVRVRDYGTQHTDLFPTSSTAGQLFARVTMAVGAIEEHLKKQVLARAEARKVKAATRAAVFDYMKTIAQAARRVTRLESGQTPFRMPKRRTLKAEIATAKAFIEEARKRLDEFLRLGLPTTFLSDFQTLVDALQQAVDVRLNSKTGRRHASAGITTQLKDGLDAIRDLEVVVTLATRSDPTRFAAWQSARRIEGQGTPPVTPSKNPAATTPGAPPETAPAPVPEEPTVVPTAPETTPVQPVDDEPLPRAS